MHQHPDFRKRLSALALAPGVYLMKDDEGTVIYVGKAMALRNRVRSYFQSTRHKDPKTRELVSHIADFDVIRTDTPTEALILENELIKKYLPKYNVMLKDSKTYPYIRITNEEWPRVISTRQIVNDGSRYFGPYTSAGAAYKTINLLNRLFPYRKCDKKITGHDEVCLYYHMHQCTAPCISAVDRETYMKSVERRRALPLRTRRRNRRRHRGGDGAGLGCMELRAGRRAARPAAGDHPRPGAAKDGHARGAPMPTSSRLAQGAGATPAVQVGFLRNGKIIGSEFFPDAGGRERRAGRNHLRLRDPVLCRGRRDSATADAPARRCPTAEQTDRQSNG